MGLYNIQHLNDISYQKVQIINLNRVLMIICRGTNETDTDRRTQIFTQYSGILTPRSSYLKNVFFLLVSGKTHCTLIVA
jgi:hypothetical protein